MRGLMAAFALMALTTMARAAPPPDIAQMIGQEEAYNDICRGGSGDSPITQSACKRRDELDKALTAKGWCWGPENAAEANKQWQPCQASSAPQLDINSGIPVEMGADARFYRPGMACGLWFELDLFEQDLGKAALANDRNSALEADIKARERGCGPVPANTVGKVIDSRDGTTGLVYYRIRFKSGEAYWVPARTVRPAS